MLVFVIRHTVLEITIYEDLVNFISITHNYRQLHFPFSSQSAVVILLNQEKPFSKTT